MALADQTSRISEAMLPGILGLFAAVMAFWFHGYLHGRLKVFDCEMRCTSLDLVNRLLVHLQRLKTTNPAMGAALSRGPRYAGITVGPSLQLPGAGPRLTIERMYRPGLLELIWPELKSGCDATVILDAASWICFAYGIIGCSASWIQDRPLTAVILVIFFATAGTAVRRGYSLAPVSVRGFLFVTASAYLLCYGITFVGLCVAIAPVLLIGGEKAARWLGRAKNMSKTMLAYWRTLLVSLTTSASIAVLFGTTFGLYATQLYDNSMQPTISPGDWLFGVTKSLAGPIHRAEVWEVNWGGLRTVRVVGLPGDRVQIRAGRLMLNGKTVQDPYSNRYTDPSGDFPLSSKAYSDDSRRSSHERAYGEKMDTQTSYLVPDGRYFVLNDNREQPSDSRTMGPLSRDQLVARLILVSSTKQRDLSASLHETE
jgi:signal peptidase I